MTLPTASQLVSAYKKLGPLTAGQITGASPFSGSSGGSSTTNPHDAPGYNPATDPTSSAYGRTAAPTQPIAPTPTTSITPTTPQTAPNNAQINPPNATPGAIQATPEQVAAVAQATQQVADLQSRYKQGLATAKASGQDPTSQGAATVGVQANLQTPQIESPSVIGDLMETDNNFDSILTGFDEMFSPQAQQQSLLEQYQQLSKSLGIEQINTQLINAQNIIENTESDIRLEIEKSNGFATNSQILQMSSARNKVLLQNYNTLLSTRDNAMTQLGTMMNLSIQDRQMATAEFDRKLDFAFRVADYKEKFVRNSNENYNNIIAQTGYSGLMTATNNDPHYIGLVEKSLGLAPGGLAQLAQQDTLKQQAETRLREKEMRLAGGGTTPITSGNLEEQIANLNLSTGL